MPPNNQYPQQNGQNNLYPPSPYQTPQLAPASMLPPTPNGLPSNKPPLGLIIGLVIVSLLFIASAVVAVLFYTQMLDYKTNSDKKSAVAVALAQEKQKKELEAQFAEQSKEPLTSYTSPASYGSVVLAYPKTWSAYVDEGAGSKNVEAYFHPSYVPSDKNSGGDGFKYALRAQIVQSTYAQQMQPYDKYLKKGEAKATPISGLPAGANGTRIDGKISEKATGSVVIIPVRDKVLKIWTEGEVYINDFNNFVLKNLKFNP